MYLNETRSGEKVDLKVLKKKTPVIVGLNYEDKLVICRPFQSRGSYTDIISMNHVPHKPVMYSNR